MDGEQSVPAALGDLRDRITRLETRHEYIERAVGEQAAQLAKMDGKLDGILENQARAAGGSAAVKWMTGLAAGAAGGIAGALATLFGGHH